MGMLNPSVGPATQTVSSLVQTATRKPVIPQPTVSRPGQPGPASTQGAVAGVLPGKKKKEGVVGSLMTPVVDTPTTLLTGT